MPRNQAKQIDSIFKLLSTGDLDTFMPSTSDNMSTKMFKITSFLIPTLFLSLLQMPYLKTYSTTFNGGDENP